jgi:hypothetical protein
MKKGARKCTACLPKCDLGFACVARVFSDSMARAGLSGNTEGCSTALAQVMAVAGGVDLVAPQ